MTEWNVGCERCHGPGEAHVAHPARDNILNPARFDYVHASDTCIQCHSQGQPLTNPIQGKYYDWPVGFDVGKNLADYWKLEEHKLGETTFTHFPDGTAHKNRMQGNDFVKSLMYARGVTCFSCHDPHGGDNVAMVRKPGNALCLDCHGPNAQAGPHAPTIEAHTHHRAGSAGNECIACHMPKIAADDRRPECPQSHLPLRHAGRDRGVEDSECLQPLPHRQVHRMGEGRAEVMAGSLALADVAVMGMAWPKHTRHIRLTRLIVGIGRAEPWRFACSPGPPPPIGRSTAPMRRSPI